MPAPVTFELNSSTSFRVADASSVEIQRGKPKSKITVRMRNGQRHSHSDTPAKIETLRTQILAAMNGGG